MSRDLSALFQPTSVAIVAASDDPRKWGHAVTRQALRATGPRPLHLVNQRGGHVQGRPAARSLTELGEPADLVVVAVPATAFEQAVDDALAARTRRAIVGITAGLGEVGGAAKERELAMARRVRAAGAALVGPNCLGLVDNTSEVYLSSGPFPSGRIALLSQSGNLALELSGRLDRLGLGYSRFVSLGNQADVTLVDLVEACATHPGTEAIAVYVEDFTDGRAFAAAAERAGKPVVLLAAGRSEASARGAASHTGALTSPADVVAAACAQAGVYPVWTPRELATVLAGITCTPRAGGRRLAVLTDGGGHGAVAADVAEAAGLAVPKLGGPTRDRLAGVLGSRAGLANPVDLAGSGERDPHSYARTLEVLLAAPETDAVLLTGFCGGYSATNGMGGGALAAAEQRVAAELSRLAAGSDKPLAVHSMYPDSPSVRILGDAGLVVFEAVEDAVRALAAGTADRAAGVPALPPAAPPTDDTSYFGCRRLLSESGVLFPPAAEIHGAHELAALAMPGPYALKAMGLLHKSDAGGVALGLADKSALAAALAEMDGRLGAPSYSVEAMADLTDGVELIAGTRWDPRFGPVAMVGLGGVFAETLRDVAFALAPLTEDRALALLRTLRGFPLLDGARGRTQVDLPSAARTIAAITQLAAAHPEIAELEVNPLIITPRGALALDARAIPA